MAKQREVMSEGLACNAPGGNQMVKPGCMRCRALRRPMPRARELMVKSGCSDCL